MALYRKLAHTAPHEFRARLAEELESLSRACDEHGIFPEALQTAEESVTLLRDLARSDPAAHRRELARSLAHYIELLRRKYPPQILPPVPDADLPAPGDAKAMRRSSGSPDWLLEDIPLRDLKP